MDPDARARGRTLFHGGPPPVNAKSRSPHPSSVVRLTEVGVAIVGAILIAVALAATQHWLDRHFLPSFLVSRRWYARLETSARVILAGIGLLALVLRRPIARLAARVPARPLHIALAAALALGAGELVLSVAYYRTGESRWMREEPRRRPDPWLGWTLVPGRTGRGSIGGRVVEYAIDAAGYRVRRVDEPVDPQRPAILFTGESVMVGDGLTWEESIPAQVGAMLDVQSANLAVDGFGTDQAYLRLRMELPRFRRPVAVVSLFMTSLLGRNLQSDRPHLGPGLVWLPPVRRWRLEALARLLVFYHGEAVIDRGVAVTREVLRATVDLARARGAMPLIVVPQFGHEEEPERALRCRILDGAGVPYVLIEIDPAWHLPWNRHPNAHAAHVIAEAIANRLQASTLGTPVSDACGPSTRGFRSAAHVHADGRGERLQRTVVTPTSSPARAAPAHSTPGTSALP